MTVTDIPPTVENATRLAIRSLHNLVDLGPVDPMVTPIRHLVGAVFDWMNDHPHPSDGEQAVCRLVTALWNGQNDFLVPRDLARMDKQRRREAIEAIALWNEATGG